MNRKARIRWQGRRGKLELDIILQRFLARELDALQERDLDLLEALLAHADDDLLAWLSGRTAPPDPRYATLVSRIRGAHRR